MEASPEIKTLRCAFSHLVNTISVDSVLPEARATELITRPDYESCKAEPTESKQAEKFMKCVEKAVIANPRDFESFLSILDRKQQKSIADNLRKSFREVQESAGILGARVYLPDDLKVVDDLTDLETAHSLLLAEFEAAVVTVLKNCTSTQQEVFISALRNKLKKKDFVDFQSGFNHLKEVITLFNIKYLKDTVRFLPEKMRTKPDQLLISYEEKLREFMKTTTVNDYKTYCTKHLHKVISSSAEHVTMKLSDQWMEETLDNLKMLTCKLLQVPGSRLHLHTITEDCVAVHWLCPIGVVPALKEAIVLATDALHQEGILQIFIGGEDMMGNGEKVVTVVNKLPADLKILVYGRTGIGKTSLINSLFGENVYEVGDPGLTALVPSTIATTELTVRIRGITVTIFDSPGLQDGVENDEEYVEDMYRKCKDVDLVLYCIDMTMPHFTSAESRAISTITDKFGQMIWKHCMFVLTKANLVYIPPVHMRQTPIEHHESIFKSFQVKILSLLKEAGVSESNFLRMVAAGHFDPEMTESSDPDRMILFASKKCQADPGPPIVPVDFIPELWVTCLEAVRKDKSIHFLKATISGGRIRNPTEDLTDQIRNFVDETIIHDHIPQASFDLNSNQKSRTGIVVSSIVIAIPSRELIQIGGAIGAIGGAAVGMPLGPVGIAAGVVIGGVIGSALVSELWTTDEENKIKKIGLRWYLPET